MTDFRLSSSDFTMVEGKHLGLLVCIDATETIVATEILAALVEEITREHAPTIVLIHSRPLAEAIDSFYDRAPGEASDHDLLNTALVEQFGLDVKQVLMVVPERRGSDFEVILDADPATCHFWRGPDELHDFAWLLRSHHLDTRYEPRTELDLFFNDGPFGPEQVLDWDDCYSPELLEFISEMGPWRITLNTDTLDEDGTQLRGLALALDALCRGNLVFDDLAHVLAGFAVSGISGLERAIESGLANFPGGGQQDVSISIIAHRGGLRLTCGGDFEEFTYQIFISELFDRASQLQIRTFQ